MLGLELFQEITLLDKRIDSWILATPTTEQVKPSENIDHLKYDEWLYKLFPKMYSRKFAPHHKDFWDFVDHIGNKPSPAYFLILGREEGKDANAQGAAIRLGAKGVKKFCLYVCGNQDLANKNIQTIAGMLQAKEFEKHYPAMSNRQVDKYGNSKGWRLDMLRCANGFNAVALGLDASVRSIRLDEYRPDLVIFTDIDSRKDSPETIQKKIDTIKYDILPAGNKNTTVVFLQNLIRDDGIISKVVKGKADFLYDRIVNGPIPAIDGLDTERIERNGGDYYKIIGGKPTWPDKPISEHEALLNRIGPTAFRIECQHEVNLIEDGMYNGIEYKHCNFNEVPDLISIACFVDPAITEDGDKQGIQIDGISQDGKIYRLYSWEQNAGPSDAIRQAILKAIEYGADVIGFETDQGGDLWQENYNSVWEELCEDSDYPAITWETIQPDFIASRAGSIGSKKHRGQLQLSEYEKGRFIHVRGTHHILESALQRFPKRKPFDLHDAAFWSMWELLENAPASN